MQAQINDSTAEWQLRRGLSGAPAEFFHQIYFAKRLPPHAVGASCGRLPVEKRTRFARSGIDACQRIVASAYKASIGMLRW
jgi:hypothetical protein